jgi:hypothetical protein
MTTIPKPIRNNRSNQSISEAKDTAVKLSPLQLINEALSRARMPEPQTSHSEATRPAREIAISSRRREHDRLMGL